MSLTPEQQELRKKGLGGSEIAAVAGIHPYLTALDVYLEKLGLKVDEPNRYKDWGNRLELVLGEVYAERTKARVFNRPGTLVAPEDPWILATPDFLLPGVGPDEEPHGLECKCRGVYDSHRWGPDGTDEVPDEVAAQCHWGMMVTGLKRWDVAVLLGGNDFRVYTLRYDDTIAKQLRDLGRAFWFDHVVTETPPTLDGSKSAQHFVKTVFQRHDDVMIEASAEHEALCFELRVARRARVRAEKVEAMWKVRVQAAIGEHAGILGPDFKITWKRSKDGSAVNWELVAKGLLAKLPESQQKALVSIQTNVVPGSRRFLPTFPDEKDDES